jgi:alpha-tubulin suppressor-like RCC1 family protein
VKCWGNNGAGQLGDGTTTDRDVPVDVLGLGSPAQSIAAGWAHTCALTIGGAVKCWGDNQYGQLGDGTTTNSLTPIDVVGLGSGVVAIDASFGDTCAVLDTGGLKCWGDNEYGQLGDGTTTDSHVPVDVSGLTSGVAAVSSGRWHACAITTAGGAKCWGANFEGEVATAPRSSG